MVEKEMEEPATNQNQAILSPLQQKLETISKIVGHPVEVEKTLNNTFICTYLRYDAPMSTLVGNTEDEAADKLLAYLKAQGYSAN